MKKIVVDNWLTTGMALLFVGLLLLLCSMVFRRAFMCTEEAGYSVSCSPEQHIEKQGEMFICKCPKEDVSNP